MKVCDVFEVFEKTVKYKRNRPRACDFYGVLGFPGVFDLCSYKVMRGPFGLQEGEEEGQYYLSYHEGKCSVSIVCKPNSQYFEFHIHNKPKEKKQIENYEEWEKRVKAFLILLCLEADMREELKT